MNKLNKEHREMLTDIIIQATYGYHCAITGKEFKDVDALEEYTGKYNFNSTELRLPILRNIVHSAVGAILDLRLLEESSSKHNNT
jgi:hypothetical protein